MQMRGRTPLGPTPTQVGPPPNAQAVPYPVNSSFLGPGARPRLPRAAPTPLQPKGNKYKLYKVNGGPTPPGAGQQAEGGASRRAGPGWPLLWTASHHSQLQQRVGIRHGLDVGVRHCCELVELGPQVRALEVDVGGFVSHLVTIVGGREDGDTAATMGHLVALGLDLVAADDVVQLVLLQEGLGDVRPELAAHASLADRAPVLWLGI